MSLGIKKWPVYCPLKIDVDIEKLRADILSTEHAWKSLAPAKKVAQSANYFEVADQSHYDDCEYIEIVDGKRIFHDGRKTWKGIGLRHVPEVGDTKLGATRHRFQYNGRWEWDNRFEIPYLREIVESLPYMELEIVRIMAIDPGGFGPAHVDWSNDNPWEIHNIASTTFTIDYGGSHMQCKRGNVFETDAPVFFFKDSAPHGVPPVKWRRIILRINGKVDYDQYQELMDLDRAVW